MFYQCEKTHYGKAFPAVAPLKAAVNPKLSLTGKKALHKFNGVPTNYSFYKLKILLHILIRNKALKNYNNYRLIYNL